MNFLRKADTVFFLVAAIVCLLPCLPLFWLNFDFAVDWPNQVWLANYVASYLIEQHQFPSVIHTFSLIGMPYPVFYGYLFFPLVSVLSAFWNADLSIRVLAAMLISAQFTLIFKIAFGFSRDKLCSLSLGAFMVWAIYPLTNLYNRGAIPEFFATGLIVVASVIWFHVLTVQNDLKRFFLCNLFVFSFTLAAGSHPITALYGACFLALTVVLTVWIARISIGKIVLSLVLPMLLALITLAPWVLVTVKFTPKMALAASFKHVGYYKHSLDSAVSRLLPFPIETKSYKHKLIDDHAVTPHLDTQINVPLLGFLVLALLGALRNHEVRNRRAVVSILVFTALSSLMLWSSVAPGSLDKLGHNFRTIQFAYRLVTYINLSFFIAVLVYLWQREKLQWRAVTRITLVGLLIVSLIGLAVKLNHAFDVMVPNSGVVVRTKEFSRSLTRMPDSFYGADAYTITNLFTELTPNLVESGHNCPFEPSQEHFGSVKSVGSPVGIAMTNIQQFPWNFITAENSDISRLEHSHRLACNLAESKKLEYDFRPEANWAKLRIVSITVFFTWLALTLFSCAFVFARLSSRSRALRKQFEV